MSRKSSERCGEPNDQCARVMSHDGERIMVPSLSTIAERRAEAAPKLRLAAPASEPLFVTSPLACPRCYTQYRGLGIWYRRCPRYRRQY